ncbi:oxidoreductase [Aphelenchoides avenae]|nr:oxidoreductase [Aphelenchus avenae]
MSNGIDLPLFGYGTWLANKPDELKVSLRVALDAGYRLIDTAYLYSNESVIGEVLEEYFKAGKLKREDVFITSKLPPFAHKPDDVAKTVEKQLKDLRTEYVDLYLIHNGCPCKKDANKDWWALDEKSQVIPENVPHIVTWRALEGLYKHGKLIGVSNFNERQIRALYAEAEIKPHNLQVERHILWPQNELFAVCNELGITFTAYAPIGSPGAQQAVKVMAPNENWPHVDCMGHPVVQQLAKKYDKSPAQILLRHMVQRGISTIPKSTNPKRVVENISIFDFELTADDRRLLESIPERLRIFQVTLRSNHPWYPYDDVLENLGLKRKDWSDFEA